LSARVLFILKKRPDGAPHGTSNGLSNSVKFVVDMLKEAGVEAELAFVVDNNCIHREVVRCKPTHVVIEALWVVPEKFEVLRQLCPGIKWIVRGHSAIPFMANEGIAIDWVLRYIAQDDVHYAANSADSVRDFRRLAKSANPKWSDKKVESKVLELTNFYPYKERNEEGKKKPDEFLDVACFGAVRPLKNQLMQAVAAIAAAERLGKTLRFHINGTRPEQGGDSSLRNIRALFIHTPHQLVEHNWYAWAEFKEVVKQMDLGLQVSFSETFNIVAADMIVSGLPIVVSPEIVWTSPQCQAEPTNSEDIIQKMLKAVDERTENALRTLNLRGLKRYCEASKAKWLQYLRNS
jgi:glycosyltransferase involved in cell wall biosynthesis